MRRYEEYQPTQYDWLPEVPEHWDERFLQQGASDKCVKNVGSLEDNVLSLSYGQIIQKKNKLAGLTPADFSTYQIVNDGDIILRLTDLQNDKRSLRTGLVTQTGIITAAYTCLKPFGNSAYLHYLLHAYDLRKVFYGMGGGVRQSIGFKDIRHMYVYIPPREEQNQIVRYLDWKVSEINRLIAIKKKQIASYKDLRKAVIDRGVLHDFSKTPQKDSGVYWLGKIPENWEVMPLKRVCRANASVSTEARRMIDSDFVVFLPMENVSETGEIDCSIKKPLGEVRSGFSSFAKGDVVVAKITPCFENGKGACLDSLDTEIGFGTTEFINLRPSNKIVSQFLYLITMTQPFRKLGERVMTGSAGQKRVPLSYINNFTLGIPSINEQKQILAEIDIQINKIDGLINKKHKEVDLLHELKSRLISDVVTGQIDVRDVKVPDFDYIEEEFDEELDEDIENADFDEEED